MIGHRTWRHRVSVGLLGAVALAGALGGCSNDGQAPVGARPSTSRPSSSIAPAVSTTVTRSIVPSTSSTVPGVPSLPDGPTAGVPGSPARIGSYPVGMVTADLVDTSRGTPANGTAKALDHRNLPTWIWYPAAGDAGPGPAPSPVQDGAPAHEGRFPIVLFGHGVTGRAMYYQAVLQAWASAGYIVVAPDFPLSNGDTPGGPVVLDVGQQPADLSFILTQLLGADPPRASAPVVAHLDAEHIAVAGHSLGAITALSAGFGVCCAEPRIDAVVDWAGALYPLLDQPSPDPKVDDVPLLIIHGDADGTVPYRQGEEVFAKVHTPRWFITLIGGEHTPPYVIGLAGQQSMLTTVATLDFFDAQLKGDKKGLPRLTALVKSVGPEVATLKKAS